jgi:hypothetical protein
MSDAPATYDSGGREFVDGRQVPTHTQLADWDRSDEYHNSFLVKKDDDLNHAMETSRKAGLPEIGMPAFCYFTQGTDHTIKSGD